MKNYSYTLARLYLIAFICLMQNVAFSQSLASIVTSEQSSGNYQNGSNRRLLSEVLKETESKFGVFFTYKNKTLEGKTANLNSQELTQLSKSSRDFDEILTDLLTPQNLKFKKIDNIYFIYSEDEKLNEKLIQRKSNKWLNTTKEPEDLLIREKYYISNLDMLRAMRQAMAVTVSGKVTGENNEALPGVNVTVKNSTTGTVTDANGNYSLSVPNESSTLVFSYIGYTTEEVAVGNRTKIDIQLIPDIKSLSEVVVVGYGTQQRRDVTGAIASVNASDIKTLPLTGLDQALQGRAAGVQVTQNSGAPGGSVSVRIRGVGSINGSEPLYVIDGFPTQGGLNSINPNDIESIEILKDAGASAIYGSRASNGVVLVTTKRGKSGKAKIEFDSYYGIQGPWKKIDVLSGPEFATLANEAFTNSNTDPRRANENQEPLNPLWADPSSLPTYDWQDAIFQNAPIQSYNLGISGGTEKLRSAVTASYFRQEGLIVNSHYQRFTFRANNDFEVTSKLKFGNSLTIARENSRSVPTDRDYDGVLQTAYQMHPMQPISSPDGMQSETLFGLGGYGHFPLTTAARYYPRQLYNPIWGTAIRDNNNFNLRLLGTLFGEYEIIDGLRLRTSIGVDLGNGGNNSYTPHVTANIFGNTTRADASQGTSTNSAWNWINTLSYNKTFAEKHAVSALVGVDALKSQFSFVGGNANTFLVNDIRTISNAQTRIAYGGIGDDALLSYIGRVTYAFDDKYLLAFNIRRDGSSKFGPENRFGTFPSASVGWRISKENFMESIPFVSDLKIRGSWGQLGNQNIPQFRFLNTLSSSNIEYSLGTGGQAAAPGIQVSNLGNPNIKWETVEQTDIGIDAAFFDNKLTLVADYYIKTNIDMLVNIPVPISFGAPSDAITRNAGSIRNKGWEFALGYNQDIGAIRWSASLNFATLENEVLSLGGGAPINRGLGVGGNNAGSRTEVGQPLAYFWGLKTDGIFQTPEEVQAANGSHGNVIPGDRRFVDVNNDGIINEKDRVNIGNGLPDFFYGGNFNISFKGFDFTLFLQGQAGNKIANNNRRHLYDIRNYNGQGVQNVAREMLGRWTGPGTSNTLTRVAYFGTPGNNQFSDFYVEDGGFLRARNIQLGYTIPSALTNRFGVERIRVYVSSQNLFTITKYTGYDPEIGSLDQSVLNTGFDQGRYPVARTIIGGLNLQF